MKQTIRLTESELHNLIKESVNNILKEYYQSQNLTTNIQNALDNGQDPKTLFNEIKPLNNGTFAVFRHGQGCNLMTQDKKLIFPEWFKYIYPFYDGMALAVYDNNSVCYIKDKTFEKTNAFQSGGNFENGYAAVKLHNKDYALGVDGKLYNIDIIEHPSRYNK